MSPSCEDLKAHLAEVLVEWHAITGEQPWLSMPLDVRLDHLPELLRELSDAALRIPVDPTSRLNALTVAAEHGEDRRLHGFSDGLLFTEYYLLRQAVWRYIRGSWPLEEAGPAIMRIDTAMTLASRAALYGYHARELRELGHSMPDLLTELLKQWPVERGHEEDYSGGE